MNGRFICLIALSVVCFATVAAAETIDVHDFEPQVEQRLNRQVTLSGRFASLVADRIKLVGSKLEFRLSEGAGDVRAGAKNVELTGRAVREGGRIVFRVDLLTPVASDLERFDERRQAIRDGDFAALYELSRWARGLAQRYDDAELRERARTAYREAFAAEHAQLVADADGEGLLALAERAKSLGLSQDESIQLTHQGLWIVRRKLAADDVAGRRALADRIAKLLPRDKRAAPPVDAALRAKYLAQPVAVYNDFDRQGQARLHRVFWEDLTEERLRLAASQGASPAALADEATRLLPENAALAHEFRLAEVRRQAADVAALSRGKLLALRSDFNALGALDEGDKLLDAWLAAQRAGLPPGDVEACLRLAADFRDLVGDTDAAVALYQQAWRTAPGDPEVERELRALGFEWLGGAWQRTSELRASEMETQRRNRVGGIALGDTEQSVIARLRKPDRVARTVTATAVFEQWIYAGPQPTYIYLRRAAGSQEAIVTAIEGATAEAVEP